MDKKQTRDRTNFSDKLYDLKIASEGLKSEIHSVRSHILTTKDELDNKIKDLQKELDKEKELSAQTASEIQGKIRLMD